MHARILHECAVRAQSGVTVMSLSGTDLIQTMASWIAVWPRRTSAPR
jgi:hypothetical protein